MREGEQRKSIAPVQHAAMPRLMGRGKAMGGHEGKSGDDATGGGDATDGGDATGSDAARHVFERAMRAKVICMGCM